MIHRPAFPHPPSKKQFKKFLFCLYPPPPLSLASFTVFAVALHCNFWFSPSPHKNTSAHFCVKPRLPILPPTLAWIYWGPQGQHTGQSAHSRGASGWRYPGIAAHPRCRSALRCSQPPVQEGLFGIVNLAYHRIGRKSWKAGKGGRGGVAREVIYSQWLNCRDGDDISNPGLLYKGWN